MKIDSIVIKENVFREGLIFLDEKFLLGRPHMSFFQCRISPIGLCGLIVLGILLHAPVLVAQDTARFIGLGHLPGGSSSMAFDVSANGLVVVGREVVASKYVGFRWTEAGGLQSITYPNGGHTIVTGASGDGSVLIGPGFRWSAGSFTVLPPIWTDGLHGDVNATAVSIDGSIIVGSSSSSLFVNEATLWSGGQPQALGLGPNGNMSVAAEISPDGTVIVGSSRLNGPSPNPLSLAWRIVGGGGIQSLGTGTYLESAAGGVSNGGEVIVGTLAIQPNTVSAKWTPSGGWEVLQGTIGHNGASDVSADGSIIVGSMNWGPAQAAFFWNAASGARDLKTVLENEYHLDLTGWILTTAQAIDTSGTVIVGYGNHNGMIEAWYVKLPRLQITKPRADSLWIAGEKDTIKWIGGRKDQILIVDYSIDSGKTFLLIDFVGSADTGIFVWTPPRDFLSKKCFIRIVDFNDQTKADTSDMFRIKPYILTRDSSGQYEPYRPEEDRWGFWNNPADMWPPTWYQHFDYRGIDPFTNSSYSLWQGGYIFFWATSADYPDWVSWVNTFGVDACYVSTALRIYSPTAVLRWDAFKRSWKGSCFGLATSNALAFSYKGQFHTAFSGFPAFANAITAPSDSGAKTVVHELFTHQVGNPHSAYRNDVRSSKTPTETLNDLKQMLTDDDGSVRILCLENNGSGGGAHAILAYGIDKDPIVPNAYYIRVYDNSYSTSAVRIWINTAANGGTGSWSYANRPGWGGEKYLYLYDPAVDYFNHPTFAKPGMQQSPFVLAQTELRIFPPISASTRIRDNAGNVTGFFGNTIHEDIPGSTPLVLINGSETPPYGYALPTGTYSVSINNFAADTAKAFLFTGNRTVSYRRTGARPDQTDRLFFDGGVAVANPDQQIKTVSLTTIINETTREKLFALSSIELSQNDSVKIENPDSNTLRLISQGTAKDYDLELNYVSGSGIGRFGTENIPLSANTTHRIAPDWNNVTTGTLKIFIDRGNDGTIDDTLSLKNHLTGMGSTEEPVIPQEYRLEQNYPNPFNPATTIRYALPKASYVSLKIYNVLGQVVVTLVDGIEEAGYHSVEWNASRCASGAYFYRLQAGSFAASKRLAVLR
jgi:uncharacterized membrane protein